MMASGASTGPNTVIERDWGAPSASTRAYDSASGLVLAEMTIAARPPNGCHPPSSRLGPALPNLFQNPLDPRARSGKQSFAVARGAGLWGWQRKPAMVADQPASQTMFHKIRRALRAVEAVPASAA